MDASRGFEVGLAAVQPAAPASSREQPNGGREQAPVVMWLLVLGSVVIAAVVGRLVAAPPDSDRTGIAIAQPLAVAVEEEPAAVAPLPEVIVLTSPAAANMSVTTRELEVRGYLRSRGGTIRVTLEARGNRMIDEATLVAGRALGEYPTGSPQASFETRFGLPNPRPNGRMVLQVALLDVDGRILDLIRRPFRVGPLLEGTGG